MLTKAQLRDIASAKARIELERRFGRWWSDEAPSVCDGDGLGASSGTRESYFTYRNWRNMIPAREYCLSVLLHA